MKCTTFKIVLSLVSCISGLVACNPLLKDLPKNILTLTQEAAQATGQTLDNSCISPLAPFVYKTRDDGTTPQPNTGLIVHPNPPWQIETQIPPIEKRDGTQLYSRNLVIASNINGQDEIWVQNFFTDYPTYAYNYSIYNPETQEWLDISGEVGEQTGVFVAALFVGKDGSIWGQNSWEALRTPPQPNSLTAFPLLSKYNNKTKRFEFDQMSQGIPAGWYSDNLGMIIVDKVLLDKDDNFWFLVSKDAIYSYNTDTHSFTLHADISKHHVQYASIAFDGKIYFVVVTPPSQKGLFFFDPSHDEIMPVDLTYGVYDSYLPSVFVDHVGRLWLGGLGWRDIDETTWYRLHPSPIFIVTSPESNATNWQNPFIILESSDGRLWFRSDNGIAWLDLEKQQWCWFTTYQSNIVEDSDHNLWMIADGKLYKNQLAP